MSVITAAPPVSRARQLAAATVGNIVEWFDWYVYSMLALYFSAQFFPKTGDPIVPLLSAMAIFAVGFFMRPWAASSAASLPTVSAGRRRSPRP